MADGAYEGMLRRVGGGERVEGVRKSFLSKQMENWEMREWQELWNRGETGRWTHELWSKVNRRGCGMSEELTLRLIWADSGWVKG